MGHETNTVDVVIPGVDESPLASGPPTAIVKGRKLRAAVVNENAVRAAAGLTMAIGAIAFSIAFFDRKFIPLRIVACLFTVEFFVRVTAGLRYSPVGVVASWITRWQPPQWVSLKPKLFAWTLGLTLASSMAIITNIPIHGWLPRSICIICLVLMWLESALGLCLGCEIYARLVRRGWMAKDPKIEVCANGVCELPARPAAPTKADSFSL